MLNTHDTQTVQSFILTLSLCSLHFERDNLKVDTALSEALSVINIANGIVDFIPDDRHLSLIVTNLKKVGNNYIINPRTSLLDTPVNDTLFQLRYNLRIVIDYLSKTYSS